MIAVGKPLVDRNFPDMNRPDIGAVKAPQVEVNKPFFIEMQLQRLKDGIDAACALPTSKGVVDSAPWAETFWQISPRSVGVEYPENAIKHQRGS